ncbi:MAG: hydroxyacylglutathione hydrolase [Caldimonas sp.]
MNLTAVPAFSDNYIWMIDDGRSAIVVDPGEAAPVLAALDARRLALAAILVTHHHADHVGGVDGLRSRLHGPVFGPARESVPQPCFPQEEGDVVEAMGLRFEVIDVPGHTSGHIAFFNREGAGEPIVFCGDTLFSAGCGKLFEGTPAQMHASLSKLAALPDATRVCCGHEYTLSNLKFAQAVEPGNAEIASHIERCRALRAQGKPTVPSPIGRERRINPFLRTGEPDVVAAARAHGATASDGSNVLAAIRTWKNEFR